MALEQMDRGQIEHGFRGVGVQGSNALEAFFGFGQLTQAEKHQAQLAVCARQLGRQPYRTTVRLRCGSEVSFSFKEVT